jgi:hypothetical protein
VHFPTQDRPQPARPRRIRAARQNGLDLLWGGAVANACLVAGARQVCRIYDGSQVDQGPGPAW